MILTLQEERDLYAKSVEPKIQKPKQNRIFLNRNRNEYMRNYLREWRKTSTTYKETQKRAMQKYRSTDKYKESRKKYLLKWRYGIE